MNQKELQRMGCDLRTLSEFVCIHREQELNDVRTVFPGVEFNILNAVHIPLPQL
jgi:hypothetical protein